MALGISEAVSLSGRVVELVKAGATLELQEKIMELREAVLNAKEEVLSLRQELSDLKRAAAQREQLVFDGMLYWQEEPGRKKEGPFCPRCRDSDSKLVRLHGLAPGANYDRTCLVCNTLFAARNNSVPKIYRG